MDLNDFMLEIATTFDRHAGMATAAQRLLRDADQALSKHVPAGIEIVGSGGKAVPTYTPWVGFFDPDETSSPQRGLYVVYLFAADMRSATLSLMQGITELSREIGPAAARVRLAADAEALRRAVGSSRLNGLSSAMELATMGWRQRAYKAGNVAALRYDLSSLPAESVLRSHLTRFLELYQDAVATKRRILQESPGIIGTGSRQQQAEGVDLLLHFKPKNDADYVSHVRAQVMRKSRRHETLVCQYGQWAAARGFACSTREHPIDLVVSRNSARWLVEAKVLYQGNATEAVRAAVGQLLTYMLQTGV